MSADYQTALNLWARRKAHDAAGIPFEDMTEDVDLVVKHTDAVQWSEITYQDGHTEVVLTVPHAPRIGRYGVETYWEKTWYVDECEPFDLGATVREIIAAGEAS